MARFDASSAQCLVLTYKEGLLSAIAHDLELRVERFDLNIDDAPIAMRATLGATSLKVLTALRDGAPQPGALSEQDKQKIEHNIAEDVLFRKGGGCVFCHIEEKRTGGGDELDPLPVYKKTAIETRWFKHARFNHERHRMLDCTECHKAKESAKTSDVLMPTLEKCQNCHQPSVGVRSDCAECHNYHDRFTKHDLHKSMTIEKCLGR